MNIDVLLAAIFATCKVLTNQESTVFSKVACHFIVAREEQTTNPSSARLFSIFVFIWRTKTLFFSHLLVDYDFRKPIYFKCINPIFLVRKMSQVYISVDGSTEENHLKAWQLICFSQQNMFTYHLASDILPRNIIIHQLKQMRNHQQLHLTLSLMFFCCFLNLFSKT